MQKIVQAIVMLTLGVSLPAAAASPAYSFKSFAPGMVGGTPAPVADYGISFAGTGTGYVRVPQALPSTSNWSVEAWLTVEGSGGVFFCDSDGAGGNDMFVGISPTLVVARGDKNSSSSASGGSWQGGISWNHGLALGTNLHHVVFSAGTGTFKVFIDGSQVVNASNTLTNNNNHGLVLGKWSDSNGGNTVNPYNGKISEIRYYSRALSATEAATAYAAGRNRALDAGTVAAWTFQENTGTSVADSSGNGYTGTLTGSVPWVSLP